MKKINNKGFTLVEILAVIIILGVIAAITIPTITTVITKNKEDNYTNLENSILSAAKIYISDNRYNISLTSESCDSNNQRNISMINGRSDMFIENESGKLKVSVLINSGDLNDGKEKIINPKNNNQVLDLDNSYVIVKYNCNTKDYEFMKFNDNNCNNNNSCLIW